MQFKTVCNASLTPTIGVTKTLWSLTLCMKTVIMTPPGETVTVHHKYTVAYVVQCRTVVVHSDVNIDV